MRCIPLVLAFQLKAVFRIAGPEAIDAETIVTARRDLPSFEVCLSNYFAPGFDASVYAVQTFRAPRRPFFARADHNPLVDGNYLAFPRDRQAVLTIFDGRWEQPPHPVEWCINRYLAAPLAIRRDKESGLTALVMSPPGDCFAVATPYNQTPPDDVANHRSLYLSLFGFDVAAGQTVRARSRLQVIADPADAAAEKAYEDYARGASGK